MELLVLVALLLLGLWAVMIRRSRSYTRGRAGAPAPVVQKIGDPADAHRSLIEDADNFSNRPVLPFFLAQANGRGGQQLSENISSVPYGPHWRALRCNLTAETLHPSRLGLAHLEPLQREPLHDLIASLSAAASEQGAAVVVRDHLYLAVFRVLARLCFGDGVDRCDISAMQGLVRAFQLGIGEIKPPVPGASMLAKLLLWRQQRQLLAIHRRLGELFLPIIAARRRDQSGGQHHHDDDGGRRPYVDSLIQLRVPAAAEGDTTGFSKRALTDDEMVNLLLEFLGAGTGSLVVCLEWTLAHIVGQPEVQKTLRCEVEAEGEAAVAPNRSQQIRGMPYMHAVVLESLRMHPPVPFALRLVKPDAAGMGDLFVQFLLGDMGRDGKAWKDPDEFRPERFLAGGEAEGVGPLPGPKETRMMPFGAGHRFCPGVGLTMVIVKSYLAALVREFEWAPPTDAIDLTDQDAFFKTMKKPLSARLTRRT